MQQNLKFNNVIRKNQNEIGNQALKSGLEMIVIYLYYHVLIKSTTFCKDTEQDL